MCVDHGHIFVCQNDRLCANVLTRTITTILLLHCNGTLLYALHTNNIIITISSSMIIIIFLMMMIIIIVFVIFSLPLSLCIYHWQMHSETMPNLRTSGVVWREPSTVAGTKTERDTCDTRKVLAKHRQRPNVKYVQRAHKNQLTIARNGFGIRSFSKINSAGEN